MGANKDDFPYNDTIENEDGVQPFGVSYILKTVFGDEFRDIPNSILAYACYKGNGLHKYAEEVFNSRLPDIYEVYPDLEYNDLPMKKMKGGAGKLTYFEYLDTVKPVINSFHLWYNKRLKKIVPLQTEVPMWCGYKYDDTTILVAGTTDLVCLYDGVLSILDYKTNSDSTFSKSKLKYVSQLHLYAYILSATQDFPKKGILPHFSDNKATELVFDMNKDLPKLILDTFVMILKKFDKQEIANNRLKIFETLDNLDIVREVLRG